MLINGNKVTIGLALSGGGFRAALFHLGVLKRLLKLGILWEIDLISSLSGGSITGAFIALHWRDEKALDELEQYLTSQSLTSNYYTGILNPFKTRTEVMANNLRKNLFGDATLSNLQNGPRSYICTSNLATGGLFTFIAGGDTGSAMGDNAFGYQQHNADKFRVADAVAASCAFAPIFPPYRLNQSHFKSDLDFITLSDGGLYDNLAVDPLLTSDNRIDYAIVSDAGKPFSIDKTPTESGLSAVWRSVDVLTEKVRLLQLDRLSLLHKTNQGPVPICFSIDSSQGCQSPADSEFCSAIPSELSGLDRQTSSTLQRHAQNLLMERLNRLAPELLFKKS